MWGLWEANPKLHCGMNKYKNTTSTYCFSIYYTSGWLCALGVCELYYIIARDFGCRGAGRAVSWLWLRGLAAQETRQSAEI